MDSSRTPLSPGSNKRRRVSPSAELPMGQTQQQQTSLPSIRQLHPYLPSMTPDPSYNYSPPPSHYPAHLGQVDMGASHSMGAGPLRGAEAGDHETDDVDQRGPPKKKRRRQALSCTECKRRKIKCDRTQPCTPCTRRGEEAGCQWHIVEPVEKYATKAEFDDLKARFEHLAAIVQRLLPSATSAVPYYQMGLQPPMPGVAGEAVQPYGSGASSSMAYPSLMPPPPQPPHQQQAYSQHMETSSQATNRPLKLEVTQSPTRHTHSSPMGVPSTSSPIFSSTSLPRHRPENSPISAAATVKASPLSLASITSPYHPDQSQQGQSKNFHAQTLILGERLRPGSEDPTSTSGQTQDPSGLLQEQQEDRRQLVIHPRVAAQIYLLTPHRRRLHRVPLLRHLTRPSQVRRGGLVIRPRVHLPHPQHETAIGPA